MLKKHMAACLVATAALALPALAQTSTAPAPATTAPSSPPATTSGSSASSGSAMSGQFMAQPEMDQVRASKVIGVGIFGSNNERIGDVNDVLMDRQGNVDAIVIGVGGFLGIGEKNVAVPFKSVEWMWEPAAARTGPATGTTATSGAGTGVTVPATTAPPTNPPATGPAGATGTTGAAGTTGTAGTAGMSGTAAGGSTYREAPERGVVKMSKADLEGAPRFSFDMNRPAAGTAPKQ